MRWRFQRTSWWTGAHTTETTALWSSLHSHSLPISVERLTDEWSMEQSPCWYFFSASPGLRHSKENTGLSGLLFLSICQSKGISFSFRTTSTIKEDYWPCKNPFFQERKQGGFKPYITAWYLVPNLSGFRKKNSVCCDPYQSSLRDQRTLTGLFCRACSSLWPVVRSLRGMIYLQDAQNKTVW